ncbi:outer membrane protein assembly factor BamE [Abyssibius alkaniclasticus]|uniref:outer membrane protein assembly factor BamE n=1 Tax=Abyssibius alkaniclasticus TaxID=2881234 RepID=UPI0023635EAB|nr:outer membrane protein assembly factor BamE [Abyssibius alkaniclasticus]UPH70052.1 outer membrane protein assembly factor BamE [Abyssibius alkaniclasticus]|tara:strand:+ start:50 stop:529 length:480 start_codon:yes stop_codon:yes gene_type:complete
MMAHQQAGGKLHKAALVGATVLLLGLSGCVQVDSHGFVPLEPELAQVGPGMAADDVRSLLGAPATEGFGGTNSWYYISTRVERRGPLPPRIAERQIVGIGFDSANRVTQVERLSLADGRLIDLNNNITITDGRRLSFFEQLLGNLGNFSAESFVGGSGG